MPVRGRCLAQNHRWRQPLEVRPDDPGMPARKDDSRLSPVVGERRPVNRERPSDLWTLSPALLTIAIVILGELFKRDYSRDANDFGVVLVLSDSPLFPPSTRHHLVESAAEVRWVSMVSSAFFGLCSLFCEPCKPHQDYRRRSIEPTSCARPFSSERRRECEQLCAPFIWLKNQIRDRSGSEGEVRLVRGSCGRRRVAPP